MKVSRSLLSLLVVVLVLSLILTPAAANTEPPVLVEQDKEVTLPDSSGFTVQPLEFVMPPDLISVDMAPVPISPYNEIVYDRTPTFYFNRDFAAKKYRIEVYSYNTASVLYTFVGRGDCPLNAYYCSLTPDDKLAFKTLFNVGLYSWRVQSYTGVWESPSPSADFYVLSKGFFDSFLKVPWNKWVHLNEPNFTWVLTPTKSLLKAPGETGWWSTIMRWEIYNDVDLTVRMKRSLNETNTNAIFIWGDPLPTDINNLMNDAVYFQYNNKYVDDGKANWSVFAIEGGTAKWVVLPTPSDAIKPFGWNELRIVGQYPYVDLWINGTYLGWFEVAGIASGYTGVSMVYSVGPTGPLLVDWVKARAIPYGIAGTRDPDMQIIPEMTPATMEEITGQK